MILNIKSLLNDEHFSKNFAENEPSYKNWRDGYPMNESGADCIAMDHFGKMFDVPCTCFLNVICHIPLPLNDKKCFFL